MEASKRYFVRFVLALMWIVCLFTFVEPEPALSEVDRTKWAWSENAGWLNVAPAGYGITDHDTHLSGYIWHENVGWIKLGVDGSVGPYDNSDTTNWGVNLDKSSYDSSLLLDPNSEIALYSLSGYAWSENAGWINFDPIPGDSSVVPVSYQPSTKIFSGWAWSGNMGYIMFTPSGTLNSNFVPQNLEVYSLYLNKTFLSWTYDFDSEPFTQGFNIYRKGPDNGEEYQLLTSVELIESYQIGDTITYWDENLDKGTYYYGIRAYDAQGTESDSSLIVEATIDAVGPSEVPSDFDAAAISNSEIELTWNDNTTNKTGYEIYRQSDNNVEMIKQLQVGFTEDATDNRLSWTDSTVTVGDTYTYWVRAYNAIGYTDESNRDAAMISDSICASPTDLDVIVLSLSRVSLTWKDVSDNEVGFKIYRSKNGAEFELVYTLTYGGGHSEDGQDYYITWEDTNLDDIETYQDTYVYRVTSYNMAGESEPSNDDTAIMYIDTLDSPQNLEALDATLGEDVQVELKWTDLSDNKCGFKIYRKISGAIWGGESDLLHIYTDIEEGTEAGGEFTWTDTSDSLIMMTSYTYAVTAYNADSESDYSSEASVTTFGSNSLKMQYPEDAPSYTNQDGEKVFYVPFGTSIQFIASGAYGGVTWYVESDKGEICEDCIDENGVFTAPSGDDFAGFYEIVVVDEGIGKIAILVAVPIKIDPDAYFWIAGDDEQKIFTATGISDRTMKWFILSGGDSAIGYPSFTGAGTLDVEEGDSVTFTPDSSLDETVAFRLGVYPDEEDKNEELRLDPALYGYTEDMYVIKETSLSGIVSDDKSGYPISGASVSLIGTSYSYTTGEDGAFEIEIPDVVTTLQIMYQIKVTATGYMTKTVEVVDDNEPLVSLEEAASISGVVECDDPESDGTVGVEGAEVVLSYEDAEGNLIFSDPFTTGSDGSYTIACPLVDVKNGKVWAWKRGYKLCMQTFYRSSTDNNLVLSETISPVLETLDDFGDFKLFISSLPDYFSGENDGECEVEVDSGNGSLADPAFDDMSSTYTWIYEYDDDDDDESVGFNVDLNVYLREGQESNAIAVYSFDVHKDGGRSKIWEVDKHTGGTIEDELGKCVLEPGFVKELNTDRINLFIDYTEDYTEVRTIDFITGEDVEIDEAIITIPYPYDIDLTREQYVLYDDGESWQDGIEDEAIKIIGMEITDGRLMMVISTKHLTRFQIANSIPEYPVEGSSSASSGGGCFITSASESEASPAPSIQRLMVLVLLISVAAVFTVFFTCRSRQRFTRGRL
jgi:hypothetical protein